MWLVLFACTPPPCAAGHLRDNHGTCVAVDTDTDETDVPDSAVDTGPHAKCDLTFYVDPLCTTCFYDVAVQPLEWNYADHRWDETPLPQEIHPGDHRTWHLVPDPGGVAQADWKAAFDSSTQSNPCHTNTKLVNILFFCPAGEAYAHTLTCSS